MITLDDLQEGAELTTEDLVSGEAPAMAKPNQESVKNLATHAALLSEGESEEAVIGTYDNAMAEMERDPNKDNVSRIMELAKNQEYGQTRDALTDFLADPNVSDELKEQAAVGVLDINTDQYNSYNILSRRNLSKESTGENMEAEYVRVGLADAVEEMNAVKKEQQGLLNSQVAKGNASLGAAFADIAEYFVPFVEQKDVADALDGMRDGEGWAIDEAFTMLGNTKMELKDMLNELPPSERMEFTRKLALVVEQSTTTTLIGENDYGEMDILRTVLEDGYYGEGSKWIDNVAAVLDLVGLGATLKKPAKALFKTAKGATDTGMTALRDSRRAASASRAAKTSAAKNAKDTNPSQARAMHEAAAADETGDTAAALYGTTREDAISSDLAPQIASVSGAVEAKLSRVDLIYRNASDEAKEVLDDAVSSGFIELTKAEKVSARTRVVNQFEQADGFTPRKEMSQIDSHAGGVKIKSVYGPAESGFSSGKAAMDSAKWALRDFGVTDADITLLVRQGGEYVPTSLKEMEALGTISKVVKATGPRKIDLLPKKQKDFLVQVEHDYAFNPADVTEWSKFDVKYNIFDRLGVFIGKSGQGSLQRTLIDPASSLDPTITLSASSGFDKAAHLEKSLIGLGDSFATKFKKMPKDRQKLMDDLIRESNEKGLGFDHNKMVREGFDEGEIDAMRSWREYWDTAYVLENRDLARTKKAQGYSEFIDEATDTKLVVKPLAHSKVGTSAKVFDHSDGSIKTLNKQELADLYKKDGTVAQMAQPMKVGDEAVELVVSRNSPGSSYLRGITDSTEMLSYRKGYYTVQYTDPQYIVKVVKGADGVEYQRAVATAGNRLDAEHKAQRLADLDEDGSEFLVRGDKKGVKNDSSEHWDLLQARGRTSQRVRGQRLEDSTTNIDELSTAPIANPVESLVSSSRSIANRVPMRKVIETHKMRFMDSYSDFLPDSKFGGKTWTTDPTELKYRGVGSEDGGRLADARTTMEYINYLENGYVNALDDGIKTVLKQISNWAGEASLKTTTKAGTKGAQALEKVAKKAAEVRGVSAMGKNASFQMYLAASPLRQFIVQGHQAVQLLANHSDWIRKGNPIPEMMVLLTQQAGLRVPKKMLKSLGMDEAGAKAFYESWRKSGASASIDKQNLIRGALNGVADEAASFGALSKAKNVAAMPLTISRKIGFDSGEYFNLMTSWLAHRHKAIANGEDITDLAVLDTVAAKARNFTYNMNAAGDMPYNQNALALVFQFMQVPHKAMLTMTANRVLSRSEKLKLIGFNGLMFTLPVGTMLSLLGDNVPEDPVARDAVLNGMYGLMLNSSLSAISGEEVRVDWGGLSPLDMYGTAEFVHSLFTEDPGTTLANTPAGQLFFGGNPRVTNWAKATARYFNLIDDYENPTTFGDVALEFAKLSSGLSAAFKSGYAKEFGLKRSSYGGITDPNVTSMEALIQAAGFQTLDESQRRWVKKELYEKSAAYREDVQMWYTDLKRHVLRKGISPQEQEYTVQVFSEAFRVWGNGSQARTIIQQLLRKDISKGDVRLYNQVIKAGGFLGADKMNAMIDSLGGDMTDEKKANLKGAADLTSKMKGEE